MRRKTFSVNMQKNITAFDIFGHQVGVTYRGDMNYRTNLGGAFSVLSFILLAIYTVMQVTSYVKVADPNVISMVSRIDSRSTEVIRFSDF